MSNQTYRSFIYKLKQKRIQICIDNKLPIGDWKNKEYNYNPVINPFFCFYINQKNELILNKFIVDIEYQKDFDFNKKDYFYQMLDSNENFKALIQILHQVFESHNVKFKNKKIIDLIEIDKINCYKEIFTDYGCINNENISVQLSFSVFISLFKLKKLFYK